MNPSTLSTALSGQGSSSFDRLTPSGGTNLQIEMPTSARTKGSGLVANQYLLEVTPAKGRSISYQSTTLPPADMSDPRDEGYTIQGLESAGGGSTIQSAGIAPQGSSGQMLLPSGTLIPASRVSPTTQIPVMSPAPGRPTPISSLSATASLVQSPMSLPYNPRPNQTPSLAKRPVDNLYSLLETKQSKPPGMRPTGLVHEAPSYSPQERHEFREMTLGCRFGMSVLMCTTIPICL